MTLHAVVSAAFVDIDEKTYTLTGTHSLDGTSR
jgi:hypothetical protein